MGSELGHGVPEDECTLTLVFFRPRGQGSKLMAEALGWEYAHVTLVCPELAIQWDHAYGRSGGWFPQKTKIRPNDKGGRLGEYYTVRVLYPKEELVLILNEFPPRSVWTWEENCTTTPCQILRRLGFDRIQPYYYSADHLLRDLRELEDQSR